MDVSAPIALLAPPLPGAPRLVRSRLHGAKRVPAFLLGQRTPSRRRFLQGLAGLGLAVAGEPLLSGCTAPASPARPLAKTPHIGFLIPGSKGTFTNRLPDVYIGGVQDGLRELGYVEGKTIAFEYRWADEREERLPALAAELARRQVDVIVTVGNQAAHAAKGATSTIPIVMGHSSDPVGSGLVASLARPGGNLTGLALSSPGLAAKRLYLLRDLLPEASRVAVLWKGAAGPDKVREFDETQAAARDLGIQLQPLDVSLRVGGPNVNLGIKREDLDAAFQEASRGQAQALFVLFDPITFTYQPLIVALAAQYRLPDVYEVREFVDAGGLLAYGPNLVGLYRRAAVYVDKILRGAKPAGLPVEQPTRFDFAINLRTAHALGLTIPQSVLLQATEVIQ
jgi:putative ABC transport system substrate-binding protein